ncbi:MAG TPA: HEAT repeat domain-containing protein, partial [Pirellulales bacterium]
DRRIRQESQFELVKRGAAKELTSVALNGKNQLARIHALWGMGQIGAKTNGNGPQFLALINLFTDPDAEIRAQAAKTLGALAMVNCDDELIRQLKDESPRARFFAAMALGKRRTSEAFAPLVKMVAANNDSDPFLRHAAIMGLVGCGTTSQVVELWKNDSRAVRLAAVVALRRKQEPRVEKFLADKDPLIVLEAARAIHDVPIEEALPALAAAAGVAIDMFFGSQASRNANDASAIVTQGAGDSDAFIRRVLNANYILGDALNAMQIATMATHSPSLKTMSDALLIEALDMLGNWGMPLNRDRVLGAWRPVVAHEIADAAMMLKTNLYPMLSAKSKLEFSDAVRGKVIETIGKLQIHDELTAVEKIADDADEHADLRVEALRALSALDYYDLPSLLVRLLNDSNQSVRSEARRLLVKINPQQALGELRKALEGGEVVERQQALAAIIELKSPEADAVLAAAMEQLLAGNVPEAMQLDLLEAVETRDSPKLKEQLEQYVAALAKDDPLAVYRVALYGGNAEAGEKIVRESQELSCKRCHKFGHGAGGVGPQLTFIGKQLRERFSAEGHISTESTRVDSESSNSPGAQAHAKSTNDAIDRKVREYLLEAVVLPSKTIAKGFETVIVLTDDGHQHSGVLQAEDEKQLRLITPQGIVETVDKSAIEQRSKGLSAMPADLVNHMTRRQLRDLVEFLANLNGQLAEPELPEGAAKN